ncbi:MAG: motility associated factor glycosyltransferase family protein [Kiloniellaceae bacterium]
MGVESAHDAQTARDFFEANLAAVKKWAPSLYSRLSAISRPNTELVVDERGTLDLGLQGQAFYGGDAVRYADEQVQRFFKNPVRHWIKEPDAEKLLGSTGDYCGKLVRRMAAEKIVYDPGLGPQDSHFLVIFGVGLGLHLKPLVEATGARVIILVEPNLEFLYQSLHVTDWAEILGDETGNGTRFSIIVERAPLAIANKVSQILRANNPALLDGLTLFSHYPSAILDQAKDMVRQELFLALSGLGFFEDELVMSRNALGNLSRESVEILSHQCSCHSEPVFVIGSGPSVDKDWDFIVQNADRAILMSIGTGLRGLLARGIRPDFHVELENGTVNPEIMAATAEDFDLGGITLLASATVQPRLAAMFDRAVLFFRERVSSTLIFGGPFSVLQPAGPTVANSALICAIRLGFREIYLFGVDMGSKVAGRYHAKGSVYGAGLRQELATPSRIFPGNFGGEVNGVEIFNWSRKVLENVLSFYRGLSVYNCSDGARIGGAVPKVTHAIRLSDVSIDREALMGRVSDDLVRCTGDLLQRIWQEQDIPALADEAWTRIEEILARVSATPEPDLQWVHDLYAALRAQDTRNPVIASFLCGTLAVSMGCTRWYDRRIVDAEQRRAFRRLAVEEFQTMVGHMKRRLSQLLDEIDNLTAASPSAA